MKVSKSELEDALLYVAKNLKCEGSIRYILLSQGLYQASKDIVTELFVQDNQFNYNNDNNFTKSIKMIRDYLNEMKQNGTVSFNNSKVFLNKQC